MIQIQHEQARTGLAILAFTLAVLVADGAHAQMFAANAPHPDAGSLQQQIERERNQPLPPKLAPEQAAPQPREMKPPSGTTLTVSSFRFAGNTKLTDEQLAPVVASFLNRPLSFSDLQEAATAIANFYRDAGWVVRAYLPEQEIQGGSVTIQIVEAVFGKIQFEGDKPTRGSATHIVEMISHQQKPGELLNADALDRGLLLAGDEPELAVAGSLKEGAVGQQTDVVLKLTDKPYLTGDVGIDNTGSRSTGADRATANLNINSPSGAGEIITATVLHTQNSKSLTSDGSDYVRLGATVPVGLDGLRVGMNASYLNYRLISDDFVSLDAVGTAGTVGVESNYPLIRTRTKSVYLTANFDHKTFYNQSSHVDTSHYRIEAASLGLNSNIFDDWGGGGSNTASLTLVTGEVNLDGSPNKSSDATAAHTAGTYTKVRSSISRQQQITEDLSLYGGLSGQLASKNLDSSEKFYLGGSSGIRAYPANEGGGSEAYMMNVELRYRLPEGFTATGFYDQGRVIVNTSNTYSGATGPNGFLMRGAGLALAWQVDNGPTLKAVWSHRIGSNPNPSTAGYDQDGTLFKDRFWLTASFGF